MIETLHGRCLYNPLKECENQILRFLKNHWNLLGALGSPGVPWGPLGSPGIPWGPLGFPYAPCRSSWGKRDATLVRAVRGTLGYPRKPRGTPGNSRDPQLTEKI